MADDQAPHPGLMPHRRPQAKPQDTHPTDYTSPGGKTPQTAAQTADVAELIDAVNRQTVRQVFNKHGVPPSLRRAFPVSDYLDGHGFLDADALEQAVVEAAAELDELHPQPRRLGNPRTPIDALRRKHYESGAGTGSTPTVRTWTDAFQPWAHQN